MALPAATASFLESFICNTRAEALEETTSAASASAVPQDVLECVAQWLDTSLTRLSDVVRRPSDTALDNTMVVYGIAFGTTAPLRIAAHLLGQHSRAYQRYTCRTMETIRAQCDAVFREALFSPGMLRPCDLLAEAERCLFDTRAAEFSTGIGAPRALDVVVATLEDYRVHRTIRVIEVPIGGSGARSPSPPPLPSAVHLMKFLRSSLISAVVKVSPTTAATASANAACEQVVDRIFTASASM